MGAASRGSSSRWARTAASRMIRTVSNGPPLRTAQFEPVQTDSTARGRVADPQAPPGLRHRRGCRRARTHARVVHPRPPRVQRPTVSGSSASRRSSYRSGAPAPHRAGETPKETAGRIARRIGFQRAVTGEEDVHAPDRPRSAQPPSPQQGSVHGLRARSRLCDSETERRARKTESRPSKVRSSVVRGTAVGASVVDVDIEFSSRGDQRVEVHRSDEQARLTR